MDSLKLTYTPLLADYVESRFRMMEHAGGLRREIRPLIVVGWGALWLAALVVLLVGVSRLYVAVGTVLAMCIWAILAHINQRKWARVMIADKLCSECRNQGFPRETIMLDASGIRVRSDICDYAFSWKMLTWVSVCRMYIEVGYEAERTGIVLIPIGVISDQERERWIAYIQQHVSCEVEELP